MLLFNYEEINYNIIKGAYTMLESLLISLFSVVTLYVAFEYLKEKIIEKEKTPFHERLRIYK